MGDGRMGVNPSSTDNSGMAVFVAVVVGVCVLAMTFVLPKVTRFSRKQWSIMLTAPFVLFLPWFWYIFFVVAPSNEVDPKHVARLGALNLLIVITVYIFIGRRVLK